MTKIQLEKVGIHTYSCLSTLHNGVNAQAFGKVYKGILTQPGSSVEHVAIKTIKLSVLVNFKMTICYYCREISVLLVCSNSACSMTMYHNIGFICSLVILSKWQLVLIKK